MCVGASSVACGGLQVPEFVRHARDRTLGKEGGHAALEVVDGRRQEVPGAHREVGDAEVEEEVGRACLISGLEALLYAIEVLVERRVERSLEQVFDDERRREV